MQPVTVSTLFESVGINYAFVVPLAILLLLAVLVVPALMRASGRTEAIGEAAYCYLAMTLGILFMASGGLPAFYAVLSQQLLPVDTYMGLLFLFAVGGCTFLWHDARVLTLDPGSRLVAGTLYLFTWKFVGLLVSLFAGLTLCLQLLTGAPADRALMHLTMFLFGLLVSWFTRLHHSPTLIPFATHKPLVRPATSVAGKKTVKKVVRR